MSKIHLTRRNKELLAYIKKNPTVTYAEIEADGFGNAGHHLQRLFKSRKVRRDKKSGRLVVR